MLLIDGALRQRLIEVFHIFSAYAPISFTLPDFETICMWGWSIIIHYNVIIIIEYEEVHLNVYFSLAFYLGIIMEHGI